MKPAILVVFIITLVSVVAEEETDKPTQKTNNESSDSPVEKSSIHDFRIGKQPYYPGAAPLKQPYLGGAALKQPYIGGAALKQPYIGGAALKQPYIGGAALK